jgi:predicted nucleic acid-binding protein
MRRYLLDTAPVAALLNNRPAAVALMTPWIDAEEAATSIVVYGEVIEYFRGAPNFLAHRRGLRQLLRGVSPYFLTYAILERYADIRRELRRRGPGVIGDVDTLIAATALERDLTVVTIDGDYQRVPGLRVMLLSRDDLLGRPRP